MLRTRRHFTSLSEQSERIRHKNKNCCNSDQNKVSP